MRCVKGFGPHPEDNGKSTEKVLVREWHDQHVFHKDYFVYSEKNSWKGSKQEA